MVASVPSSGTELAKVAAVVGSLAAAYKYLEDRLAARRQRIQTTFNYLEEYRKSDFVKDRYYIRNELLPDLRKRDALRFGVAGLPEADQLRVRHVSNYLDYLGHLIELGIVDKKIVLVMIGKSVETLWVEMRDLICSERTTKGQTQGGFEHVARLAREHPALLKMPHMSPYDGNTVHPLRKLLARRKVFMGETWRAWKR